MSVNELIDRYGVIGTEEVKGIEFPVVGISMMSDEQWQQMAIENAINNFKRIEGKDPASQEEAVKWQRERVERREHEETLHFCRL